MMKTTTSIKIFLLCLTPFINDPGKTKGFLVELGVPAHLYKNGFCNFFVGDVCLQLLEVCSTACFEIICYLTT